MGDSFFYHRRPILSAACESVRESEAPRDELLSFEQFWPIFRVGAPATIFLTHSSSRHASLARDTTTFATISPRVIRSRESESHPPPRTRTPARARAGAGVTVWLMVSKLWEDGFGGRKRHIVPHDLDGENRPCSNDSDILAKLLERQYLIRGTPPSAGGFPVTPWDHPIGARSATST